LDLRIDALYRQPQTSEQSAGSIDVLAQLHAFL
jgi:hypothetical protein